MSSVHEVIPWAYRLNYAASKGGVMLFMKSLAQEVAAEKIDDGRGDRRGNTRRVERRNSEMPHHHRCHAFFDRGAEWE